MSYGINAAKEKIQISCDKIKAISENAARQNREYTDDEVRELDSLDKKMDSDIKLLDSLRLTESVNMKLAGEKGGAIIAQRMKESGFTEKDGSIVTSNQSKTSVFTSTQDAYDSGMFFAHALFGSRRAQQYCENHNLISSPLASMIGGDNSKGGYYVPEILERTIVELREKFGTFRSESQVISMTSDNHVLPKVVGELTSYYVSEMSTITPSDMELTQLRLTARKLATLTAVSSELEEDGIISTAELLTRSIAYSFALKEDQAGFLGDGGQTYGGIVGLAEVLAAGSISTATGHQTFGTLTLADFETVIGKAKMWAGSKPKWYISQQGWANSMQRLLDAAGGNTLVSLAMGAEKTFLGFPVVINQVLPSALTGTTATTACYFGDLKQGVYFGSRRGVNVQVDPSVYFTQDALAVRATERYDINIHDTGTATEAGGIIKLIFG